MVAHAHTKVAADRGETAHIPCRMKAFPAPTFIWEWRNTEARTKVGLYEVHL